MNFCRRCGEPLTNKQNHVYTCTNGHIIFANHSPAVGIFFVSPDNKKVLLTTRGIDPGKGMLGTFGGFLDAEETFEEAAVRELNEEANLELQDYEPFTYITSEHDTYTYGKEDVPVVSTFFWSRLRDEKNAQAADEIDSVDWYPLATLDFTKVHAKDVRTGIQALQKLFSEGV
jgi:NAD+ diphosphatase